MSCFSGSSSHLLSQEYPPSPDQHHSQLPSITSFLGTPNQPSLFSSSYFTQTPVQSPLTWSFPSPYGDMTYPMDALTLTYRSLAHGVHAAAQYVPKPVKQELELVSHPQFAVAPSPKKTCACNLMPIINEMKGSSPFPTPSMSRASSLAPAAKRPRTDAQRVRAREYARAYRERNYAKVVGMADAPPERMEKIAETAVKMFKVKQEPVDSDGFNEDDEQALYRQHRPARY